MLQATGLRLEVMKGPLKFCSIYSPVANKPSTTSAVQIVKLGKKKKRAKEIFAANRVLLLPGQWSMATKSLPTTTQFVNKF